MDSIIYKYRRLLTEGYNFTNVDEVYDALEANQIGVKTQPEYKKEEKWGYTCEKLRKFFNKCEGLGIKDTTKTLMTKMMIMVKLLMQSLGIKQMQQLENTVGKDMAHRLTHLDNEKPGTRFPVHVMKSINQATHRPDLYEEVNYFDY